MAKIKRKGEREEYLARIYIVILYIVKSYDVSRLEKKLYRLLGSFGSVELISCCPCRIHLRSTTKSKCILN